MQVRTQDFPWVDALQGHIDLFCLCFVSLLPVSAGSGSGLESSMSISGSGKYEGLFDVLALLEGLDVRLDGLFLSKASGLGFLGLDRN